jgi:hypothetical protein
MDLPPPPPVPLPLPPARHLFDKDHIQVHNLGPMNVICLDCKAYHWSAE